MMMPTGCSWPLIVSKISVVVVARAKEQLLSALMTKMKKEKLAWVLLTKVVNLLQLQIIAYFYDYCKLLLLISTLRAKLLIKCLTTFFEKSVDETVLTSCYCVKDFAGIQFFLQFLSNISGYT